MQYDVETSEQYLEVLKSDWRKEKLLRIRELILAQAPDIKEGIEYKMLSYGDGNEKVFYLNAQKNYVSLYVGNIEKVDPDGVMLKGLSKGKGCIRFGKSVSVDDTRIGEFIERTVNLWKEGKDVGC